MCPKNRRIPVRVRLHAGRKSLPYLPKNESWHLCLYESYEKKKNYAWLTDVEDTSDSGDPPMKSGQPGPPPLPHPGAARGELEGWRSLARLEVANLTHRSKNEVNRTSVFELSRLSRLSFEDSHGCSLRDPPVTAKYGPKSRSGSERRLKTDIVLAAL